MTVTRKDIRRAVGDRLDDLKVLTARIASSGLNTFRDDVELTDAQNAYLASQAMPTAGTLANIGRIARVIGSDSITHTITVTPDMAAIPAVGDEWELVNLNGRGWRFQDYHRMINEVLGDARGGAKISVTETIATAFSADSPDVTIPTTMTEISGVFVEDSDGERTMIPRARKPGGYGNGYWLEGRTLRLEGGYRNFSDGLTVVLVGTGPHPAVTSDTSVITVDPAWLVPEVAARMASRSPDRQRQALGDRLKSEAEARRANSMRPRSANSQVIR